MYLCGFTLFLSLILNRTYTMILEQIRLEDTIKQMKGDPKANDKDSARIQNAGDHPGEVARLRKDLAERERDLQHLQKQAKNQQTEYNRMGDQVAGTADATPKKDR